MLLFFIYNKNLINLNLYLIKNIYKNISIKKEMKNVILIKILIFRNNLDRSRIIKIIRRYDTISCQIVRNKQQGFYKIFAI